MTVRQSRLWLLLALILAALANLWPLDLLPPDAWPRHFRDMLLRLPDAASVVSVAVWIVIGLLAVSASTGQPRRMAVLVLIAAVGVELIETIASGRHASLADGLVAGFAGAAAVRYGGRLAAALDRLIAGLRLPALALLALVPPALILLAGQQRPFANWATNYPLIVGHEAADARVWDGEIMFAAIYAAAPDDAQARALADLGWGPEGLARRSALGAVLICAGGGAALDPDGCGGPGASTADLVAAVQAAGAVAVEVLAVPGSGDQPGWPRILTLSPDPWRRNLTLGQQGDALYLRVRTPWSGRNGIRQGLTLWPGVLAGSGQRHLLAVYDGRQVTAYAGGRALTPRPVYRPHFQAGHDGPAGDAAIAALAGLGVGALASGFRRPWLLAVAALLPTGLALLLSAGSGGLTGAALLAGLAALACAGGVFQGRGGQGAGA